MGTHICGVCGTSFKTKWGYHAGMAYGTPLCERDFHKWREANSPPLESQTDATLAQRMKFMEDGVQRMVRSISTPLEAMILDTPGMDAQAQVTVQKLTAEMQIVQSEIQRRAAKRDASSPCPQCGKPVMQDFVKCPYCAVDLRATAKCARCGKGLQAGFALCPYCGTPRGSR